MKQMNCQQVDSMLQAVWIWSSAKCAKLVLKYRAINCSIIMHYTDYPENQYLIAKAVPIQPRTSRSKFGDTHSLPPSSTKVINTARVTVTAPNFPPGIALMSSSVVFVEPSSESGVNFFPVNIGITKHIMNWMRTAHDAKYMPSWTYGGTNLIHHFVEIAKIKFNSKQLVLGCIEAKLKD